MPHSFGYRSQTRHLFQKKFGTAGRCHTTTYLRTFKRGDYVDIKVDPSIHKGMPFKYYHGRTGVVFNVTKRAVGVRVNKPVNGRIINKQIHVSIPHVHASKCRDEVIARKASNEEHKRNVREGKGEKKSLKRQAVQPKEGYFYTIDNAPETITPLPYVDLV
mmetsp:Transcript_5648/g.4048  ORF Transcript_5648/g.4048 Transcript_5648/m.4048 type:complete len:161 (-) Transcript_5648:154-636(-)|eukprot:CAMPEP_0116915526 /NCGR_PEP_ID=MMETSP0467-20121206/17980_1 /TAXON_ID=283647 /ORGANISM="Mesodinium pulex, Strain SPMC105" /LENGTH=160 /DNA_ID=CAMNT_0004592205 /DNA_START=58 /DNA_END=540 /DNA_ORIENTATION=-